MKVKDLLAKLAEFDPELPVVVSGYELGYDDPKEPRLAIAIGRDYEGGVLGKYDNYNASSLEEFRTFEWFSNEDRAAAFVVVAIER